jgi:hypothetical protein
MPRLLHGAVISVEQFRSDREKLLGASADIPLAFAAVRPVDMQDFDYLFPELQNDPASLLPISDETRAALIRLGQSMRDTRDAVPGEGDSRIPAIYTYFGQFVDHDITLETSSASAADLVAPGLEPLSLGAIRETVRNLRTATLDLDSVYGLPAPRNRANGRRLKVGNVTALNSASPPLQRPEGKGDANDLPREPRQPGNFEHDRAALTGDPRNDENTIISQLHTAFLHAHNKLVERGRTFKQAKRLLRRHYQHIVIHDFLKRIADPAIVDDILQNGNKVYSPTPDNIYMPLEFSVAVFRFGHSMVRGAYDFNLNFNFSGEPGTFPATLALLFTFSALSGELGDHDTLPDNWIIEWERFVDGDKLSNLARRMDTKLVEPLIELHDLRGNVEPGDVARLAVRNLLRGYLLRMPTGQAVAKAMAARLYGVREIPVLTAEQLEQGAASPEQAAALRDGGFLEQTPLWYYIMAEAAILGGGEHLGPVGSTIVAEVLIDLVRRSEDSILDGKFWRPSLPCATPGSFTLADLLRFAGVLS